MQTFAPVLIFARRWIFAPQFWVTQKSLLLLLCSPRCCSYCEYVSTGRNPHWKLWCKLKVSQRKYLAKQRCTSLLLRCYSLEIDWKLQTGKLALASNSKHIYSLAFSRYKFEKYFHWFFFEDLNGFIINVNNKSFTYAKSL